MLFHDLALVSKLEIAPVKAAKLLSIYMLIKQESRQFKAFKKGDLKIKPYRLFYESSSFNMLNSSKSTENNDKSL